MAWRRYGRGSDAEKTLVSAELRDGICRRNSYKYLQDFPIG